jgi:hypothetical protein
MADEFYVGYEEQLRQIVGDLQSSASVSASAALPVLLFNISGPVGAGKRTLIKRLWSQVSSGETPRILFTLNPSDTDDVAERLLADAKTNRSYLDQALEQMAAKIAGQAKRLEEAGRPLPAEARLTLWSELVEQHLIDEPGNSHGLQIIFALPDFMALPKLWRDNMARLIPRGGTAVDCRLIVTTEASQPKEELTTLFPERIPVEEFPLPILTPEQVEQWLRGKGLPLEFTEEIYRRSTGLPGRLEHVTLEVMHERQERILVIMAESVLNGLDDAGKQLLCTAAMLPEISQLTLRAVMSAEDAQNVMQMLRQSDWPESGWRDTSFVAGSQIRQALVRYLETRYPQAYHKAVPLAEQFVRIHSLIPVSAHREILASLSAFNYFNDALLRELMPKSADEAMRLVQANQNFFESTGSNFKLKPEVRQSVEAYMKMVDFVISDEDRAKIVVAWEARRRKIMDLAAASEVKVKKDTDALGALQVQIKQLGSNIDEELDRINRMRRRAQRKVQTSINATQAGNGMQVGRLAMQIVGFIIIYMSFLFYSRTTLIYAAVGVGLIVGALFVKGGVLAHAKVAMSDNAPVTSDDLDKHEKNLHFLNIKRGQLESRHNIIAISIAREKTALKEFDKQLREPYS